jgi:hypothetical protein
MKKIIGIVVALVMIFSLTLVFAAPVSADYSPPSTPPYGPMFVVWGGNMGGIHVGDTVTLWGAQWAKQVVSGDYNANSSFKGYTDAVTGNVNTGFTWTSKPGNSKPPATVTASINVIISNSITKHGSTIQGTCNGIATIQLNDTASYNANPGSTLTGIVTVIYP